MHLSFDLYPSYLKNFSATFDADSEFCLRYDIHAMRNYEYRTENGKRTGPFPQVRPEGSLEIKRTKPTSVSAAELEVQHIREWATWTNQDPACRQSLLAHIQYANNAVGSPARWQMSYSSVPILPVKSYRFSELGPMHKVGTARDTRIRISCAKGMKPMEYITKAPLTTLYTLIERLQSGNATSGRVDYLDDLTMLRPGLELTPLPDDEIEIEGSLQSLHGYALVGPAILPLYFWMDSSNRVLAIIGRNVAYTLTSAENI